MRLHRLGEQNAQEQPGGSAAQGDFVGDDEVLDIDERRGNQQGQKNPIKQRERKAVAGPGKRKEGCGENLNQRIAKGNPLATGGAFSSQQEPADDRHIFVPADRGTASRAEGTARI